jgi:hypothetical protein
MVSGRPTRLILYMDINVTVPWSNFDTMCRWRSRSSPAKVLWVSQGWRVLASRHANEEWRTRACPMCLLGFARMRHSHGCGETMSCTDPHLHEAWEPSVARKAMDCSKMESRGQPLFETGNQSGSQHPLFLFTTRPLLPPIVTLVCLVPH